MDNIRAYGEGLAGGKFEANSFFRKPTVVFKCIALVSGALLWYCISKGGWHRPNGSALQQMCLYGNSPSTCSFASALGFFAVVGAGVLLFADARFPNISAIPTRKRMVLGDLTISGVFAVIHLIAFFTFWSKYSSLETDEPVQTGHVRFGIFTALVSTGAWAGSAFFAWRRHEEGAADAFADNFEAHFAGAQSEVQDGYGYGGSSEGIGAVGATGSYQAGGPPSVAVAQAPPANSFVASEGYGY